MHCMTDGQIQLCHVLRWSSKQRWAKTKYFPFSGPRYSIIFIQKGAGWAVWRWTGCGEADGGQQRPAWTTGLCWTQAGGPKLQCDHICCLDPDYRWHGLQLRCNLGFQTQNSGLHPKFEWKKFRKGAFKSLIWNRKPVNLFLPWCLIELYIYFLIL